MYTVPDSFILLLQSLLQPTGLSRSAGIPPIMVFVRSFPLVPSDSGLKIIPGPINILPACKHLSLSPIGYRIQIIDISIIVRVPTNYHKSIRVKPEPRCRWLSCRRIRIINISPFISVRSTCSKEPLTISSLSPTASYRAGRCSRTLGFYLLGLHQWIRRLHRHRWIRRLIPQKNMYCQLPQIPDRLLHHHSSFHLLLMPSPLQFLCHCRGTPVIFLFIH